MLRAMHNIDDMRRLKSDLRLSLAIRNNNLEHVYTSPPSLDTYTTIRVSGKLLNPIVAPDMRSIIKSAGIT